MKAILLATFALGLTWSGALAQGTINFGSTSPNHIVLLNGNPPPPGLAVALYWGPLGSHEGLLIQLGATTGVMADTGFLVPGGTRTTGVATPEGANALFQVRAWTGGHATYEDALSHPTPFTRVGRTMVFTNPTGAPNASPPGPPALLTGWTYPLIIPFPEPSTASLFGLGVGLVTLFRATRKKRI